ncbi:MAG: 23S rRNA (uracil(1939)-C(5))-methyltransferase RlmD [Burkholderiales bacterium]
MITLEIESLDREARGVARNQGKAVFVDGAMTGELVECSVYKKKPSFELAQLHRVLRASASRVAPQCKFFGICGGCSMQHIETRAQVAAKQRVLEDCLSRIGKVEAEVIMSPIVGAPWGYRRRARLSVRWVQKKGGVLVGFREKKSSFVADMTHCEVLPEFMARALPDLRALVASMSIRERVPQIEVALGDAVTVLVFRVLDLPSDDDLSKLRTFAEQSQFQVWLQPQGPETATPLWPMNPAPLEYLLPEFDLRLNFGPTEFTQVNHGVNRMLVRRAIRLLDPRPGERIGDMFCGLGNFSLPIARCGAQVVGIEGSDSLVARAKHNAEINGLSDHCQFAAANLFDEKLCGELDAFDKMLIDPPREGAIDLVKSLAGREPERIVYVSCDPATLARDAEVLVNVLGYRLKTAGIVNMFHHTSHVESIAMFEKP